MKTAIHFPPLTPFGHTTQAIKSWVKRRHAITALRRLDDGLLKDIGVHRSEIELAVDGKLQRDHS